MYLNSANRNQENSTNKLNFLGETRRTAQFASSRRPGGGRGTRICSVDSWSAKASACPASRRTQGYLAEASRWPGSGQRAQQAGTIAVAVQCPANPRPAAAGAQAINSGKDSARGEAQHNRAPGSVIQAASSSSAATAAGDCSCAGESVGRSGGSCGWRHSTETAGYAAPGHAQRRWGGAGLRCRWPAAGRGGSFVGHPIAAAAAEGKQQAIGHAGVVGGQAESQGDARRRRQQRLNVGDQL